MLRAAPFKCNNDQCNHVSQEEWIDSKDWDTPQNCPECGTEGSFIRQFAMPMIMGVSRKNGEPVGAMPDGAVGVKGKGWDKIKKANKFTQLAYNLPVDSSERKEIEKEVKQLKKL